jgi:Tfp pilus assembly PilM family ATPase
VPSKLKSLLARDEAALLTACGLALRSFDEER